MGVSVAFERTSLDVEPGQEAACSIQVRNTGAVVDRVLLDVLGQARPWASAEPPVLSLLPGTTGTARVAFHPPRASYPGAGEIPFALRAMSQEDPEGSVIAEGALTLAPFTDIRADLVPKTSHVRRRGRHRLIIENRGNVGADLDLDAQDEDNALEFRFRPRLITAPPGTATFVRLRAEPRKRFFKGAGKSLPFQVFVLGGGPEPVVADGAVLQRQIMPEWLLPLLAIATLASAALIALYFLVFKPEVHSAAVQAVTAQTHSLTSTAARASKAADKANQAAAAASSAASTAAGSSGSGAGGKNGSAASGAGAASAAAAAGTPVSTLMASSVVPGKTGTQAYKLTSKQTLSVTDVLLENPAGNTGTMDIKDGTKPLFEFALTDFRDLDYHFVQPLEFTAAHPLEIVVSCTNSGKAKCTPALSFSGSVVTASAKTSAKK
ncbi:MAG TPA: hypothetical protein VGH27_20830 [Streptosporangiaceae bacterium]|jgi:hypothetical protein